MFYRKVILELIEFKKNINKKTTVSKECVNNEAFDTTASTIFVDDSGQTILSKSDNSSIQEVNNKQNNVNESYSNNNNEINNLNNDSHHNEIVNTSNQINNNNNTNNSNTNNNHNFSSIQPSGNYFFSIFE